MNYFDLINRLVSDEKTKRKRIDLKQDGNDSTFYNDRLETELVQELSELNLNLGLPRGRRKIQNVP